MFTAMTGCRCGVVALFLAGASGIVAGGPVAPAGSSEEMAAGCAHQAFPAANAAGLWTVTFANGVVETCAIGEDGTAAVAEPQRAAPGKARVREGDLVIEFDDDRIERWTQIESRMVVEHWYPIAGFGSARPVLGIAERRE